MQMQMPQTLYMYVRYIRMHTSISPASPKIYILIHMLSLTSSSVSVLCPLPSIPYPHPTHSPQPYSKSSTSLAIAKLLVRPGLSMPSKFTNPSNPSSFLTTKSSNALPPAGPSFGRTPA